MLTVAASFFVVTVVSVLPMVVFLCVPPFNQSRLSGSHPVFPLLIALATGSLLGDVTFHLLPESFAVEANRTGIGLMLFGGIYVFLIGERLLQQYHHGHGHSHFQPQRSTNRTSHDGNSPASLGLPVYESCSSPTSATANSANGAVEHIQSAKPVGILVLVSDLFHNLIDGLAIGASFSVSTSIGLSTSMAVLLHEIPHELGDFAILFSAGYTRRQVITYSLMTSLAAYFGAIVGLLLQAVGHSGLRPYILALIAGNFLYLALADLTPELLHQHQEDGQIVSTKDMLLLQYCAVAVGAFAMWLIKVIAG